MAQQTDDRYAHPLTIGGGPPLVIGITGNSDAAIPRANVKLAARLTTARGGAAEVRGSRLLPSEQGQRLNELRAQALAAVREHAQVLATESQRIKHLAANASAVRPTAEVAGWIQVEDMALAQHFAQMSISEKTQITARAMASPVEHLRWAQMLLRVAPELTGVDKKMREELRASVLEALDPQLAESVRAQVEQLEAGERAAEIARQVLSETFVGALQELRDEPPSEADPVEQPKGYFEVAGEVMADLTKGRITVPTKFEATNKEKTS
jgi:hypothetical protein